MQTDQNNRLLKVPFKQNHHCSNVTLVLVALRGKKKKHVLYTNHMYPSSVVSNVKVKSKHPSWCLYTKHKNIFKKNKQYFSLPFHTPLICSVCTMSSPVTSGVTMATSTFALLLNECDDPLKSNVWKMVKDSTERLVFTPRLWFVTSHLTVFFINKMK